MNEELEKLESEIRKKEERNKSIASSNESLKSLVEEKRKTLSSIEDVEEESEYLRKVLESVSLSIEEKEARNKSINNKNKLLEAQIINKKKELASIEEIEDRSEALRNELDSLSTELEQSQTRENEVEEEKTVNGEENDIQKLLEGLSKEGITEEEIVKLCSSIINKAHKMMFTNIEEEGENGGEKDNGETIYEKCKDILSEITKTEVEEKV